MPTTANNGSTPPLPTTVSGACAQLAIEQRAGNQPQEVLHAAKRCVIDWFAATFPGSVDKPAKALESGLTDEIGHGGAYTLSGLKAPMRTAALINGIASHSVEFDDIFAPAIYHPGSPVIAAALASAQGLNCSGRDFLNAVIAGYEVSTRIGECMGPDHYRFWHNTGTIGTIGATSAVAMLHCLDSSRMQHAISTCVTMAAGLQAAFRGNSDIKPLHAGHAADAAHIAVALARGGVLAPADIFESDVGFGAAMAGHVDWSTILAPDQSYNITRMSVKNHGCCGHIFPALDGALALQDRHGFAASDIDSIAVGGYSATVNVTGNQIADTPGAAKFCLPFIVASGLVHGSIRLDAYSDARLSDPVVRQLMPRISVQLDPEIDALFPHQRAANVTITLNDGTVLHHLQPHRIGDSELPLSDQQLMEKYHELAATVTDRPRAQQLLDRLWLLESAADLGFVQGILHGS
ncbi:MmgE/PrpD family protein [Pseudooceanicola sp.]|uniref:MmgE/PrpD family protein n=1 Tax=Pseudooceanicola sp. TaxID=1914328 RepID=UPI002625CD22|nr:MmgE/PrpD family protein [Pseudooceanicola sp.]MDF1855042.1 MmgE/PrpD family protein [Pseudooceanicola sp.]